MLEEVWRTLIVILVSTNFHAAKEWDDKSLCLSEVIDWLPGD